MTFNEVKEKADQLAAGFQELGLKRGDRLGIWAPNNSHWFLSFYAAARAGLVTVGLNPFYKTHEIEYCLKKAKVKALVAPEVLDNQNYYDVLKTICPELNDSQGSVHLKSKNLTDLSYVIIDSNKKLP